MKIKTYLSLKSKLFISIAVSVLFFGSLSSFISYYETREAFVNINKSGQLESTDHEANITNNLFLISKSVSENVAALPEVVRYFTKTEKSDQDKNDLRLTLSHFNVRNIFSSIYVIGTDGTALVSTDQTFEGNNYAFRNYFKNAMQGSGGVDMVVGVTSKKPGFYFSEPIKNEQGTIIGVAVAKLDVSAVSEQFSGNNLVGFVNYMLVGTDGIVLMSNLQDRVFASLSTDKMSSAEMDQIKLHYNLAEIKTLDYDDAVLEIKKGTRSTLLEIFDELESEEEIVAVSRIGDFPFYYVTEHYNDRMLTFARRPSIVSALFQGFGVLLAIVLSYFLISRFMRPFKSLQEMAAQISRGEFNIISPIKSDDETAELGKSIEDMAAKLKGSYENLNEEVRKKTLELQTKMDDLEKLNDHMVGREIKMVELKKEITELKKRLEDPKEKK